MKLVIVGTGYVGLVTGVCLANAGHSVTCVDIDKNKIDKLSKGIPTIYEENLESLLKRTISDGNLSFTTNLSEVADSADLIFIAVGTPEVEHTGETDLSYIEGTIRGIASCVSHDVYVVIKSTVPAGTKKFFEDVFVQARADSSNWTVPAKIFISSNPEFLKEGTAIKDFYHPDRIVIGTDDLESKERLDRVYSMWKKNSKILYTNVATAQLIKYASNAFNACKISFINSLAQYSANIGADITEVADGMGLDPRIGRAFLNAGIGWGGSCFPKDVASLKHEVQVSTQSENKMLSAIIEENRKAKFYPVALLHKLRWEDNVLPKNPEDCTITILGTAFKSNTDDTRKSPGVDILCKLSENGFNIKVYDPIAPNKIEKEFLKDKIADGKVVFCESLPDAVTGADVVIFCTEWDEFKNIDFDAMKHLMKGNVIIDGRNMFDRESLSKKFNYYCIGKPHIPLND